MFCFGAVADGVGLSSLAEFIYADTSDNAEDDAVDSSNVDEDGVASKQGLQGSFGSWKGATSSFRYWS